MLLIFCIMKNIFIDIETYSSIDITEYGAYKYIESPDFEILLISYAFDFGEVKTIDLAQKDNIPNEFIEALHDCKYIKHAHNAVFERIALKKIGLEVPIQQWRCTASKAAYCGLPFSLDEISKILNLTNKKLETGKLLIKYFSQPDKGVRHYPIDDLTRWEMYKEYNRYDVLAEREIYQKLSQYSIPDKENDIYYYDQKINDRGICIDTELVKGAININTKYTESIKKEFYARNIGGIKNINSVQQLKKYFKLKYNILIDSFEKSNLDSIYNKIKDYPEAVYVLDIRNKFSKTSIKKYNKILGCALTDNRIRGMFQYYGTRTGRWVGKIVQLQNLPKNSIPYITDIRKLVRENDIEALTMVFDNIPDILSQLLRTAFISPKNTIFSVADFSAIEARVISWIAEEQWRLNVFKEDGKIYESTGEKMFGVPKELITKGSVLRDKAKISELALGYGGGIGALKRMGGEKMGLSDLEMRNLVDKWRLANPRIVHLWSEIDNGVRNVIKNKTPLSCANKKLLIQYENEYLTIQLPSQRKLFYRNARIENNTIIYEGIQDSRQWGKIETYGGKLTENIVSGIARDVFAETMINLEKNNFPIVCHIHDEFISEIPDTNAKELNAKMIQIMQTPPKWASNLPLNAEGYITSFYVKK